MKRVLASILLFVLTMLVGVASTSLLSSAFESSNSPHRSHQVEDVPAIPTTEHKPPSIPMIEPVGEPEYDPKIDYVKKLKVKLLLTGDFHEEEVPYRPGEKWLGLFKNGDTYELRYTKLKVEPTQERERQLYDTTVTTTSPLPAIFLLKGASNLKQGAISTLFDPERDGEFEFTKDKSFGMRGQFWRLWIDNADSDGRPQKGANLMFQGNGSDPQILRSLPVRCDDCSWRLLWAGDLDRDSILDLLIDVSDHYNISEPTLFLSSPSKESGPLTVFASFRGVGC